jgi:hypothetical protein
VNRLAVPSSGGSFFSSKLGRGDEGGAKMSRTLPSRGGLEDIKKEARDLLYGLRRGDAAALERHYCLDCEAGRFQARLADAQYIIAQEYGFRSWQKMKKRLVTEFQDL